MPISSGLMDEIVERAAKAMHDYNIAVLSKEVAKIDIPIEQILAVLRASCGESPRSAAILLFSLIDDLLKFFFKVHLNGGIKGGLDSLFDGFGMLSTASSRITLAASLFWLSPQTYADANIARRIRNIFAHDVSVHLFDDEPVRGLVHSMSRAEESIRKSIDAPPPRDMFDLFLVRMALLVAGVVNEMAVSRRARELSLSIRPFGGDDTPANLLIVHKLAIRYMLEVMFNGRAAAQNAVYPELQSRAPHT